MMLTNTGILGKQLMTNLTVKLKSSFVHGMLIEIGGRQLGKISMNQKLRSQFIITCRYSHVTFPQRRNSSISKPAQVQVAQITKEIQSVVPNVCAVCLQEEDSNN